MQCITTYTAVKKSAVVEHCEYILSIVKTCLKFWLFCCRARDSDEFIENWHLSSNVFDYLTRVISDRGSAFMLKKCNPRIIGNVKTLTSQQLQLWTISNAKIDLRENI